MDVLLLIDVVIVFGVLLIYVCANLCSISLAQVFSDKVQVFITIVFLNRSNYRTDISNEVCNKHQRTCNLLVNSTETIVFIVVGMRLVADGWTEIWCIDGGVTIVSVEGALVSGYVGSRRLSVESSWYLTLRMVCFWFGQLVCELYEFWA